MLSEEPTWLTNRPISSMSCIMGYYKNTTRVFWKSQYFKSLSEKHDAFFQAFYTLNTIWTSLSTDSMLTFIYKWFTMIKIRVFSTPLYKSVCWQFPPVLCFQWKVNFTWLFLGSKTINSEVCSRIVNVYNVHNFEIPV